MRKVDTRIVRISTASDGGGFHSWGYLIAPTLALGLSSAPNGRLEEGATVHLLAGRRWSSGAREGRVARLSREHDIAFVEIDDVSSRTASPPIRWGTLAAVSERLGCEVRRLPPSEGRDERRPAHIEVIDNGDHLYEVELADGEKATFDMHGAPVLAGTELFCGLLSVGADHAELRPVEPLIKDPAFRTLLAKHLGSVPRLRRVATSVPATAFSAVAGVVLAAVAFFLNLFDTALQFVALLASAVALSILAWSVTTFVQRRRSLGPRPRQRWALLSLVVVSSLAGGSYWVSAIADAGAGPRPSACLYQIPADNQNEAYSIPLEPSGSAEQAFKIKADTISSIFLIIGFDPNLTDPTIPHPAEVTLLDSRHEFVDKAEVRNIKNNEQTQFSFREPVDVDPDEVYYFRFVNHSRETVGLYLKKLSRDDLVHDPYGGPWIVKQQGHENHRADGAAVSGCILATRD